MFGERSGRMLSTWCATTPPSKAEQLGSLQLPQNWQLAQLAQGLGKRFQAV